MRSSLVALLVAAGCTQVFAQSDGVPRCQSIVDTSSRLACYDALYPPNPPNPPKSAPPPGAAPAPAAGPASPPVPSGPVAQFGLPQKPKLPELESIESVVVSDFQGWGPNDKIRLQNGQVWEVVDGSSGTITPDMRKVKVRRGAFGSFFLDFEGLTKSPKVRRLQ